jgi:hypothetical protein
LLLGSFRAGRGGARGTCLRRSVKEDVSEKQCRHKTKKRTLSSPAQKMNSASGFWYNIRLTISPFHRTVNITLERKIN